jgi:PAS domain S-box-containing protein
MNANAQLREPSRQILTLLDCQRQVLELIGSGAPLDEVLLTIVKLVEQLAPEMRCAIALLDSAGKRLDFAAAPSIPDDFKACIAPFMRVGPDMAQCGRAAFWREPMYTEDLAVDPRWVGCRDVALRNRLRAIWSTPVLSDDNTVLGMFTMFHGKPGLPDPGHVQLIEMAVQMARLAVQNKQDAERLRVSEEKYRLIAEHARDLISLMDPSGRRLYASPSFEALYGRPPGSLEGKPAFDGVPAEERASVEAHFKAQVAKGVGWRVEFPVESAVKGVRQIQIENSPILDANGRTIAVLGVGRDITEERRTQQALREAQLASEREFRDVIENIPAIAWTTRPDGPGEFTNRSWEEYTGHTSAQAEEWGWLATVHPEDVERHLTTWKQAVASGAPFESEARYRRADGTYRWFLARGVPRRDEHGNVQRWYGVLVDVEDRKRAREVVEKSERLLREAEQLGHTGSWEQDLLTGEVSDTPGNIRLFFGEDRSKGARFEDYIAAIHPDDHAYVRECYAKLLADDDPRDIEYRVVWPDGSVHVIVGRATVVRDESGRAVRVYGTNVDATERKRAEAAVRENEQLLKFVLETLPISVVVVDPAGDIVLANAATRRMWASEIIVSAAERRARFKGFWHSSGTQLSPGEWASAVAISEGREVVNELIDIAALDGRRKAIANSAAPIRNSDGTIVGAVVVNHEVTDRVRAEEALRESAQRLQHLSRRLLDLQEEERRHLSRELHDRLGETLTALSINLTMLKESVQGDACANARIEDSAALVKSTAAAIENIVTELRPPMLDDHGLAAALTWYTKQFAARTGITVSIQAPGSDERVAPETGIALFRIAQEALNNVAKHAKAGGVVVTLRREASEFAMSISDDGIGLPGADKRAAPRGNGFGMVTMRERAQALGGRFEIGRPPEGGTRVTVSVPL